MSARAECWAWGQQLTSEPGERFVLVYLASHAHDNGKNAFPSIRSICFYTGISESQVRRNLQSLLDKGLIRYGNQAIAAAYIQREDRRPKVYDLALEKGDVLIPRPKVAGCHPDGDEPKAGCHSETPQPKTGCHEPPNGVSSGGSTGCHGDTRTLEENIKSNARARTRDEPNGSRASAPQSVADSQQVRAQPPHKPRHERTPDDHKAKVRENIQRLRLSSAGRDPNVIAMMSGAPYEVVVEVMKADGITPEKAPPPPSRFAPIPNAVLPKWISRPREPKPVAKADTPSDSPAITHAG